MQIKLYFVFVTALTIIFSFNPIYAQTPFPSDLTVIDSSDTTITYRIDDTRGILKVEYTYGGILASLPSLYEFYSNCPKSVTITVNKTWFSADTLQHENLSELRVVTCTSEIYPEDKDVGVATWWEHEPPHEDEKPHVNDADFKVERLLEIANTQVMYLEIKDLMNLLILLAIISLILWVAFFLWLWYKIGHLPFKDPRKYY